MHLLATTSASLEDLAEPVDLGQAPAPLVALSFTDSDLAGLAAAWKAEAGAVPEMRLAALKDLRHPMSVDLWIDKVARHARVIVVRVLGGYDWWRYGCERLAGIAREHGIPFYVAAPLSTIYLSTPDGAHIPIEERSAREVTHVAGAQVAPDGARVRNPAFDVTPARYVTGIITERGVFRAPYEESLRAAFASARNAGVA